MYDSCFYVFYGLDQYHRFHECCEWNFTTFVRSDRSSSDEDDF